MKKIIGLIAAGFIVFAGASYSGWFPSLFSSNYLPHRYCYLAQPGLVWTNVAMDSLIAISYALIFACLIWIAGKLRGIPDIRAYLWIFLSFGMFIVACGATHLMEVVTVWWPVYPLSAAVKVVCAAASIPTAILFARVTPALARNIRRFLDMLATTEQQRDQALVALTASENLIAERQRAAKELAGVYAQLTSVLESTSDSVITISHEWMLLYGNRKAMESLPDFKVGENYWSCFPDVLSTPVEGLLRRAMEERLETEYEEYYVSYGRWYKMHAFPTSDGLSIFFSDISEEKKMQNQLAKEQLLREKRIEALSHMAGGLAHEISNPLTIIHGRASDLKHLADGRAPIPIAEVRRACEVIVSTSDRAIRILRGLRGFSREASKDPMELASIYVIAEQCMEMQHGRFERHKIKLWQDIKPGIPLLLCREIQIGQILTNLLNNAFDAIFQGESMERWISLTGEYSNGELCIDVTDSGPGIENHFKSHLMEPFFTTKEFGLGMGVGLSLSRAIAQDHGGSLTLRTDTTHSCFRLILPITQEVLNRVEEEDLSGAAYPS